MTGHVQPCVFAQPPLDCGTLPPLPSAAEPVELRQPLHAADRWPETPLLLTISLPLPPQLYQEPAKNNNISLTGKEERTVEAHCFLESKEIFSIEEFLHDQSQSNVGLQRLWRVFESCTVAASSSLQALQGIRSLALSSLPYNYIL